MSTPSEFKIGKYDKPFTFAVKHIDFETRMASRSGGIFTALSDRILQTGGVVYGCVLDERFTAVHVRTETAEVRNKMRGSKYIQSQMRDVFQTVKDDLEEGRDVLFSGTSCQVAGLCGFLGKTYSNLTVIDIVCHGVPSPKVWCDYLRWQEKKHHSKVKAVDFRNKRRYGWKEHIETVEFANGKKVDSKIFTTLFYGNSILRPCCYRCPYKDVIHPGDITIADYWGIEKVVPGFSDNKGVSLVLINDEIGMKLFESIKENINWIQTRIEDSMQTPFINPFPEPENRDFIWKEIFKHPFSTIAKEYGREGIKARLRLFKRRIGL